MINKIKHAIVAGLMLATATTTTCAQSIAIEPINSNNIETQKCYYGGGEYFEATFYNSGYVTAIGCVPFEGGIAVDPSVIPLGSSVYVEFPSGYEHLSGNYTAVDTGGAIYGNIIDVYLNVSTDELYRLGRVGVTVYR